jgi:hypothetical protein
MQAAVKTVVFLNSLAGVMKFFYEIRRLIQMVKKSNAASIRLSIQEFMPYWVVPASARTELPYRGRRTSPVQVLRRIRPSQDIYLSSVIAFWATLLSCATDSAAS